MQPATGVIRWFGRMVLVLCLALPVPGADASIEQFLKAAELTIQPSETGSLFYPDDLGQIRLSIQSVPDSLDEVVVELRCTDPYGHGVSGVSRWIHLRRSDDFEASIEVPSSLGYYDVVYAIAVRVGDEHADGCKGRFSFAVIPKHPVSRKDPHSSFGVNTHFNQYWRAEIGKIVRKAGIAWIRDGEAGVGDKALPVAKANNLCYMPCFTSIASPVVGWIKAELEKDNDPDRKWDFSQNVEQFREYARQYGRDIDVYDLVNEPHSHWSAVLGGDWQGGDWLKVFVQWGRQVTQAIHLADPGSAVLWEDVDQLLWYKQFFDLGAADIIDSISPHPYNLHRANPYPEDHPIVSQLPEFHRFTREHSLPWEVISGEVGFSSYAMDEKAPPTFYSPNTELGQAQMLVRMMVTQLARGVKRIFWYDFMNDGWDANNPEHNFGLVRNDLSPKPAVVAYANLIHRLNDCRWLGSYAVAGGGYAYAYAATGSSKPILVAWLKTGSKSVTIPVRSDVRELTVSDIFGTATNVPVRNHGAEIQLSETPVYIEGLHDTDVIDLVQSR